MKTRLFVLMLLLTTAFSMKASDLEQMTKKYQESKKTYQQLKSEYQQKYQAAYGDLSETYQSLKSYYQSLYSQMSAYDRQRYSDLIWNTKNDLENFAQDSLEQLNAFYLTRLQELENAAQIRQQQFADYKQEQEQWYQTSRGDHLHPRFGMHEAFGDTVKLTEIGLGWVRMTVRMGENPLIGYRKIFDAGFRIFLTISHRDASNILLKPGVLPIQETERGSYPPDDATKYRELLQETLTPIIYHLEDTYKDPKDWLVIQLSNEVMPIDLDERRFDSSERFWHGTTDDYLKTLELTHNTIKSLNPSISVALGGISSGCLESTLSESPDENQQKILAWLDRQLNEGHFDIVDLHLYHRYEDIPAKISWVRSKWAGRIFSTETGGPDIIVPDTQYTEDAQAQDLPERLSRVLASGVEVVFCTKLYDTNLSSDQRFRNMSFHDSEGRQKPAFDAYKDFVASQRSE